MGSETLSFPGLGLSFKLNPVAFSIFGKEIYWYGIIIAAGFALGLLYACTRSKKYGVSTDNLVDVLIFSIIGGIVGARLYYVLFTLDTFKGRWLDVFKIWEGGVAIYGGIIGAVLVGWIVCRVKKHKFLPMLDSVAGALLLGQAIGRWGNFVNMEAFGTNTTLPWGMTSQTISDYLLSHSNRLLDLGVAVDPNMPVHPCFLYESIWCLLGFVVLHFFAKRRRFDGEVVLLYAAWYGAGRFVIEGLRTDPLTVGPFRVSQVLALLCVIAAVIAMVVIRRRIAREPELPLAVLYKDTPESALELGLIDKEVYEAQKGEEAQKEEETDTYYSEVEREVQRLNQQSFAELDKRIGSKSPSGHDGAELETVEENDADPIEDAQGMSGGSDGKSTGQPAQPDEPALPQEDTEKEDKTDGTVD